MVLYMQETFSNGEKITSHDWKLIDEMVEKLELNLAEAIELREFDKFESDKKTDFEKEQKEIKKAKNAKAKITDDEIDDLFNNVVKIAFGGKEYFQNKDFHLLVADKYTNRQTPSRLKKMKEKGYLEDLGGSPKKYKVRG